MPEHGSATYSGDQCAAVYDDLGADSFYPACHADRRDVGRMRAKPGGNDRVRAERWGGWKREPFTRVSRLARAALRKIVTDHRS